jgi:hypothetical protein
VTAMQDRGAGAGARHEGAARAARPASFCLAAEPLCGPTGRGTFQLNPGGSPEATRRAFNKRFLLDLAEDWQHHGREVFKRVRRESPASYLKVCAMLVPREMRVETSATLKQMTDEQLEQAIAAARDALDQRAAENAVDVTPPKKRKASPSTDGLASPLTRLTPQATVARAAIKPRGPAPAPGPDR